MGEWLKQIILLVILATVADLLLPTRSMQRYVRVVMGVAVLAAMLQPILPLMRADWADRAAAAVEAELGFDTTSVPAGKAAQVANVMADQQARTAQELLAARLADGIRQTFGGPAPDVTVSGLAQRDLSVDVALDASQSARAGEIAAWVAGELQIGRDAVHVHTR
ncbi:stage III sporulation protein AF [Alicyclobacillus sp.]|uniref:stage III sporulation protein AF n=1 Tax=Alicyclobacillus sp. TaxID=61169 RepID=UPI0025C5DCCF|nr:stage III sporulation protein AF [Alicyclobacillus sp.]